PFKFRGFVVGSAVAEPTASDKAARQAPTTTKFLLRMCCYPLYAGVHGQLSGHSQWQADGAITDVLLCRKPAGRMLRSLHSWSPLGLHHLPPQPTSPGRPRPPRADYRWTEGLRVRKDLRRSFAGIVDTHRAYHR